MDRPTELNHRTILDIINATNAEPHSINKYYDSTGVDYQLESHYTIPGIGAVVEVYDSATTRTSYYQW